MAVQGAAEGGVQVLGFGEGAAHVLPLGPAPDRRRYDKMRATGIKEFTCDVWVNESGRVVRFAQRLRVSGNSAHNVVTPENFSDPVPVSAPE